jgi:hypothetical protein
MMTLFGLSITWGPLPPYAGFPSMTMPPGLRTARWPLGPPMVDGIALGRVALTAGAGPGVLFDRVRHDRLLKAVVPPHQRTAGAALHDRWPRAPMQMPHGTVAPRDVGHPVNARGVRPLDGAGTPGLPVRALPGGHRDPQRHPDPSRRASGDWPNGSRRLASSCTRQDPGPLLQ